MTIDLKELKPAEKQLYLQHVIAPRPICFASTIDKEGNVNLMRKSTLISTVSEKERARFFKNLRNRISSRKENLKA